MSDVETYEGFRGRYAFLSNFASSPLRVRLKSGSFMFPRVEHAFQAFKANYSLMSEEDTASWVSRVVAAKTGPDAKQLGKHVLIDIAEWDLHSMEHMKASLEAKFTQNVDLGEQLLATGDTVLIEYNTWNDKLWGMDIKTGRGKNQLGKLLMNLRTELQTNTVSIW
jgi:hypothetical protein